MSGSVLKLMAVLGARHTRDPAAPKLHCKSGVSVLIDPRCARGGVTQSRLYKRIVTQGGFLRCCALKGMCDVITPLGGLTKLTFDKLCDQIPVTWLK